MIQPTTYSTCYKFNEIQCGTGVTVQEQKRASWNSSDGEYFKHTPSIVESYFGIDFTSSDNRVIMDAKQCRNGELVYEGSIVFIIGPNGTIGRKEPYETKRTGDWKNGDVIVKSNESCCVAR